MTADAAGGVWNYAIELARGLAENGIQTTLATMGPLPSEAQRAEAGEVPGLDLRESNHKLEWMENPWEDIDRAGEWLLSIEQQMCPDIVHLNGYVHASLPWRAPAIVVGHSCVLSWWEAAHGEPAPPEWHEYRVAVAHGLRAANLVAAPSRAMLDSLRTHYGFISECTVIPNGRDPREFNRGAKEPLVFTAGRFWDRGKNVEALESVAASMEWPVYAAGQGEAGSHLRSLGVLPQIQLREWLSRASIYALPARYEPFGLSILEAALSGCALVLGDIPSLRENWDGAALFCTPGDHAALCERLQTLIRSEQARIEFQRAARARGERFTAERMVASYIERYAALERLGLPWTQEKLRKC
ncbi:MAG: glycosyltransferase family 4 protein [Bryobacteraceae bacterium]